MTMSRTDHTATRFALRSPNQTLIAVAAALVITACGSGKSTDAGGTGAGSGVATGEGGKALKSAGGSTINIEAHNRWKEGVAGFKAAEKSGWTKERCEAVAEDFEDAADAQNKFAEALYMAGVVYGRCG